MTGMLGFLPDDNAWQASLHRREAVARLEAGDRAGAVRAARMADALERDPDKWLLRTRGRTTTHVGGKASRRITREQAKALIVAKLVEHGLPPKVAATKAHHTVFSEKARWTSINYKAV